MGELVCCDEWWKGLTKKQKEWIHYYFCDIKGKGSLSALRGADIHEMHESRFVLEGYSRK